MFYMVNPSSLPKNKKSKKSKKGRRNPELLIVNPYSLDKEEKGNSPMAKKNRRKNPTVLRSKRRRNPDVQAAVSEVAGVKGQNILNAVVAAVAGGASLAVGSKLLGERVGQGSVGQGVIAVASGLGGGAVALMLADMLGPGTLGNFLKQAAVPGAIGAMTLGFWKIAQGPVEGWLGQHGLGAWQKEFQGYGSWSNEFTPGVSPGQIHGLGQERDPDGSLPVGTSGANPNTLLNPADNPFLSGYERMGNIYNTQRLGSFERERGIGGFVPETPNARDQQVADTMKNAAGDYGGYEGTLFEPIISE